MSNPTILTDEQAGRAQANLPPAGYQRDEELARRKDNLEAMADQLTGKEKLPEKALLPDRELQHLIRTQNALSVSNAKSDHVYAWVYNGRQGQMITGKRSLRTASMKAGWMVVQGEDPEAQEFMHVDTTRRVGDVTLMKIHIDDFLLIEQANEYKRWRQQEGITARVRELGDKYRGRGIIVRDDPSGQFSSGRGSSIMETMRARAAANMGIQVIGNMVKEGNVPGVPLPGQG